MRPLSAGRSLGGAPVAVSSILGLLLALATASVQAQTSTQDPTGEPSTAEEALEAIEEEELDPEELEEEEGSGRFVPSIEVEAPTVTAPIDEITVTGTQTSSTQTDADAITSFDQIELDIRGILDVEALALNVPALHFGQVGQQAVLTLRGVGLENLTSVGEAGVGFQVDGVHLGRPSAATGLFYDLQALQVLRGPQGTQGGRNTTGGRVEIWSKEPQTEFDVSGDFTYGNYNTVRPRAVVNIPIHEEKLLTRTSIIYSKRDGYQENILFNDKGEDNDDADNLSIRAQASSYWFDDLLELRAIGTYGFQKGNGPATHLLGPPPDDINSRISQIAGTPVGMGPFLVSDCPGDPIPDFNPVICNPDDPRKTAQEFDSVRDNTQNGITGIATYDQPYLQETLLSDIRFRLIASHQQNIEDSATDFDATNIPHTLFDLRRDSRQTSVEFYAERRDVDWLDYKLGFYYYSEEIDSNLCFDTSTTATFIDVGFSGKIETESMAGYGEIGVRPHDDFRIRAALRYTDEEKRADQTNLRYGVLPANASPAGRTFITEGCPLHFYEQLDAFPAGWTPDNPQVPGAPLVDDSRVFLIQGKEDWQDFSPSVGFEWTMNEITNVALSATKSFKAGGFPLGADQALNPNFQSPYDAEDVWNFELTFKNDFDFFDGSGRINLTFFWTEYNPFQICQFNGPTFNCRDDGDATSRGVELEFDFSPIEGLVINGFFNILDARVNNFELVDPTTRDCTNVPAGQCTLDTPPGTVPPRAPRTPFAESLNGNRLPKAPVWAGSFGIEYGVPLGRWGTVTPRFQMQYQGKTYFRVFNQDRFSQDPFVKLDTSIRWLSDDARLFGEFFVTNVTDVDVINSIFIGSQFTGGQVLAQYQAPRLIGIRLGINYLSDLLPGWL